jgi:superfamily II DNA/RNA helicase
MMQQMNLKSLENQETHSQQRNKQHASSNFALILAPSREIAFQIRLVLLSIAKYKQDITINSFVGGLSVHSDTTLTSSTNIVIGTPGRILHLLENGNLKGNQMVCLLVLCALVLCVCVCVGVVCVFVFCGWCVLFVCLFII